MSATLARTSPSPIANDESSGTVAIPKTGRKLLEQVCSCPSLPSIPVVVIELLQVTARPDADLQQVAQTVAKDPALVARVLRTVNSSYYSLRHRVASIVQALPVLGLKQLRVLVAGHSIFPALKRCGPAGAHQVDCCRRSLYSATAARLLSDRLGVGIPDDCFLAALLMDIGVLAMATAVGERYLRVLRATERHGDLESVEQEQLGLCHTIVGAVLARQWKLPETLAVPIQFHHAPQLAAGGPHEVTARVIRLAGFCADVFLEHNPLWPLSECYRLAAEDFGADKAAVDAVLEELAAETRRLGAAFEVQVDEEATFARAHGLATHELRAGIAAETDGQDLADQADADAEAAAGGAELAGQERRRERRVPQSGSVTVFPCSDAVIGHSVRARFCDVSPSGIGLLFEQSMEVGSQFILGLRRGTRRATVILYRVRHCGAADGDARGHVVGAELVRVLRERDLLGDGGADSPLHRIGRVLLGRVPSVVGTAASGHDSDGTAPRPAAATAAAAAAVESGGMNDPGSVCC